MKSYIIDFGANRGQNLEYFLMKADLVIAVEANPKLCNQIKKNFSTFIESGRLVVENCAVSDSNSSAGISFYVHKTRDFLSTSVTPGKNSTYRKISVPGKTPGKIIREHTRRNDQFLYSKFDLEGYDAIALNKMVSEGFISDYVSIEAHTVDCLVAILNIPQANSFKLMSGWDVVKKYSKTKIIDKDGFERNFSFKRSSSGPFGGDIKTEWLDKKTFLDFFLLEEFGWKDIHAATIPQSVITKLPVIYCLKRGFVRYFKLLLQNGVSLQTRNIIYRIVRFFRQG